MAPVDRIAARTQEACHGVPAAPGRPSLGRAGTFPQLAVRGVTDGPGRRDQDEDRSFARDLNLDQIVAAVAGDREEHDLITKVLYTRLARCGRGALPAGGLPGPGGSCPARCDPAVFRADGRGTRPPAPAGRDALPLTSGRAGCSTRRPSTATRCGRWPGTWPRRRSAPAPCWPSATTCVGYVASAGFTTLASDTRDRKEALGRIRYCTRIRGGRVEVTRYTGEADYSAAVLSTFDRFKQGAVKDYLIHYRTQPGMNHIAAQIPELVARLFPEEFAALDEYCGQHAGFLDEGFGAPTGNSSSTWPTLTTSSRCAPPGCASATPKSPPAPRMSTPTTPSTWPWRASSPRSASRWSRTTSGWRAASGSSW